MSKSKTTPARNEALDEELPSEIPGADPTPIPDPRAAAMEKRILELEAQLAAASTATGLAALPASPDDVVEYVIPLSPTGHAIRIQGKPYKGKMKVKRRVLDQVLSMLSAKIQIEKERLADRGSQVLGNKLDPRDYGSRIAKRRQGRHVL